MAVSSLPVFSGVYVFGDSLVDPGNALKAANFLDDLPFTSAPDRAPTADKGYFNGRFTDGYNFADLVANKLLLTATKTTFPYGFEDPLLGIPITLGGKPSGNNLSFAYGGAQAIKGDEAVPDLDEQTDAYRNYAADANALYIVTIGGNDIRELVPRHDAPVTGLAVTSALSAIAAEFADEVSQLYQIGARNVLVTGIPDVGLIPYYAGASDEALRRALASDYSEKLDALVQSQLAGLALPAGAKLYGFNFIQFSDAVAANPASFGLSDLTHARTVVQQGALQPIGSGFLFFDDVHPSAQVHALVAADILDAFGGPVEVAVPAQTGPKLYASIEAQGSVDRYTTSLVAGQTYVFELLGISTGSGSLADPRLHLFDANGGLKAQDDDSGRGLNARLEFVAPTTGSYTLQVAGTGVTSGSYVVQGPDLRGSNVRLEGGLLNDTMGTISGSNYLRGGDGADLITGGSGFDDINGNTGRDTVRAGDGNDWVLGGQGNDRLYGDAGADLINGNLGNDICYGGAGNDTIRGGQDNDNIFGQDGSDWLAGDAGNDTLSGGSGADIFHTFGTAGIDRVSDFRVAEGDRVNLLPGTQYGVAQVGADTVINMAGGGQMVLVGVSLTSLTGTWIFGY